MSSKIKYWRKAVKGTGEPSSNFKKEGKEEERIRRKTIVRNK